jgi:flagellar motility protein MotE (MotC chaperone)
MVNIAEHMAYDKLGELRAGNAAWRLLAAPQTQLILAFFYQEFIAVSRRSITEVELIGDLADFIYKVNQSSNEEKFNRPAKEYLEIWADSQHAWLRRFYLKDAANYDLTSASQKAIEWVLSLKRQKFVGTESRLRTVFDLLHQIVAGSEQDATARLRHLETEKRNIEQEIEQVKAGKIEVLDDVQIKERFLQAAATAQGILADFREVEENFRALERRMLDKIVTWTQGKGELLEEIFLESDGINHSEQGRSFNAFWKFLMRSSQQEDFQQTMDKVLHITSLEDITKEFDMTQINREWFTAASQVQSTIAVLSKQLRRYVDENYLSEEQRIYVLLQNIEVKAVQVRTILPRGDFMTIDAIAPDFELPMDRPLFVPPQHIQLQNQFLQIGKEEPSVETMFEQVYVDKKILQQNIETLLRGKTSVSLADVVAAYPLKQGLTELLSYMVLASKTAAAGFSEHDFEEIAMKDMEGRDLLTKLEKITFSSQPEVL